MVHSPRIHNAVATLLRGVSQVFLQNNALTGFIMVLGLAVYSWWTAVLVLVGAAVQSAFSWWGGHQEDVPAGLRGYNGALVGAAASLDLSSRPRSLLAAVLGALAVVALHQGLSALLTRTRLRQWQLPILTAPFCVIAGVQSLLLRPMAAPAGTLTTVHDPVVGAGVGVLNAVAEVFLADGPLPGALILGALAVASWRVALWGALGAVVAVGESVLIGHTVAQMSTGLLGYSAVLVAIALGATFRQDRPLGWRLVVTLAAITLSVAVSMGLAQTPIPVYTWPFVLVTWLVLAATHPVRRATANRL